MAKPIKIPRQPIDEFSDRLGRAEDKQVRMFKQASKEKEAKMQQLFKTENGRQRLMDYIFGKIKINPLEELKEKEN